MQLLSKEVIGRALVRLDEKLGLQGVEGEVCLGLKEPKEVFDIVQKYYAAKQIPARAEQVINMVFHQLKVRQHS